MYLASRSPQRQAILEALGIDFKVVSPHYEEKDPPGLTPAELVERHSRGKALSVIPALEPLDPGWPVLGVDTLVAAGGEVMGKAATEDEAAAFLERLSGQTHEVLSGVTLVTAGAPDAASQGGPPDLRKHGEAELPGAVVQTAHAVTAVRFSRLSEPEIEAYIATGEWRGRAGAYAIQGRAAAFVESVRGDYTNVVGLPVSLLVQMLKNTGLWPPATWRRL